MHENNLRQTDMTDDEEHDDQTVQKHNSSHDESIRYLLPIQFLEFPIATRFHYHYYYHYYCYYYHYHYYCYCHY